MLNKKNQGHGICGARNIYSSKVHVDNWIEDNIGMQLARKSRTDNVLYQTNTASSYNHPSERPEAPPLPANMPSTLELKTKNKEGMPYSLLFEHNIKPSEAEERFKSTAMLTLMNRPDFLNNSNTISNIDSNYLSKKKSKQMVDDIHRSYVKVTETQIANAHLKFHPNNTVIPFDQTAPLPDFKRRTPLSSTFIAGI